jgi:amphi-Trp domain-containing protein
LRFPAAIAAGKRFVVSRGGCRAGKARSFGAQAVVELFMGKQNEVLLSMAKRKNPANRDYEKGYPVRQFVAKLRRLADCIEQGKGFRLQVDGERITIPPGAFISIEHEREGKEEEIEFQCRWLVS